MDKKEKQETLSKLYTLRAGLSLIAQERDDVNAELSARDQIFSQLNKSLSGKEGEIKREKAKDSEAEKEYKNHIETAAEDLRAAQKELTFHSNRNASAETASSIGDFIKGIIGWVLLGLVGMAISAAFIYLAVYPGFAERDLQIFFFIVAAVIIIISLIVIIRAIYNEGLPISYKKVVKEAIEESRQNVEEHKEEIKGYQEKLSAHQLDSAKRQKERAEDFEEEKQATAVVAALTEAVTMNMLSVHRETSLGIYNSLAAEYSEILDERDWQYIDLFIYMYETGRAESKKEALQLIDQYQQNKNIVDAIVRAGREVQDCIKQGLGALQTSMESHFRALSGQLYEMHSETMLKMDRITDQLDNLNSEMSRMSLGMAEISSQTADMQRQLDLNTALQAKANMTSQQIMDDVKYMRTLDENAEVRRRNGLNSYGSYA